MTFEEFITKKKIDLVQFKSAEPGLFSEFQSHYQQMGPKSFDHTKKFLFNKLRRAYHLKEKPKPVAVQETIEINEIASQAEPLLSPTVAATVYTPRFRAGGKASSPQAAEIPDAVKSDKPAYTPRFKAPPTKTPDNIPEPVASLPPTSDPGPQTSDLQPQTSPTDQPKSAYVPRFKAKSTIKEDSQPVPSTPQTSDLRPPTSEPSDKPKPAYVPRFKPAITKPAEGSKDGDNTDNS